MKISDMTALAVDKWDYIFQSLGIEVGNGKHCPCPVCGGKDRFRFDDKDGRGTWICNQCGSGDGLELIKNYFNCNAKEACDRIVEHLNLNVTNGRNKQQDTDLKSDLKNNIPENLVCKKVEYLLSKTVLGQSEYLTKKGLTFDLPLLDKGRIFAPMLNIRNEYTGAQFIEPDGSKHLMKGTNKKGSFICVTPMAEVAELKGATEIIICEGLATGITLAEIRHRSIILSAIAAGNLIHVARAIRDFNPMAKIIIGGDNDIGGDTNVGRDKAIESAKAINGYYSIPATDYKCDWDDYRQKYGLEKTLNSFNENLIKPVIETLIKTNINKAINKGNERLQSNTPANKRADILVSSYNGDLAYNRSIREAYCFTGKHWRRLAEFELIDRLISIYEDNNIDYSIDNVERVARLALLKSPIIKEQKQGHIYFDNGAYSVNDMTFTEHAKSNYNTSTNGINYKKDITKQSLAIGAPIFYQYLLKATGHDKDKFTGALAILYIILANRHEWHYFIEVTGLGGTGKSTFSEIARLLVGETNTADCDIKELERKTSTRTALIDKTLLILSDQSQYQGEGDLIKKLSSGDKIDVDPKYKQAHSFKPVAVILAVNNAPMIFRGSDSGINRRHIRLVFDTVIPPKERDPHLLDKIKKELPFIINYLLETFSNDEETVKQLELLKKSDEAEQIKRSNSPIYDFYCYLEIIDTTDGLGIGQKTDNIMRFDPKKFLFHGYDAYYRAMIGGQPRISVPNFKNQLKEIIKSMGKDYSERTLNGSTKTNIIYNNDAEKTEWLNENELYRFDVDFRKQNH